MGTDSLKLRRDEDTRRVHQIARSCLTQCTARRWAASVLIGFGLMAGYAAPARAAIECLPVGLPLAPIPEIVSDPKTHVLKGTILLRDEEQRLIQRSPGGKPGQPGTSFECVPQRVRALRSAAAPLPTGRTDPIPGPVLRARLGDVVELTFLNQIDAGRFGASIDLGDKPPGQSGNGCDVTNPGDPTQGYPAFGGDAWPDCFHGSTTGNIHFHGTHTNPNGTGDNVFLQIRPSPRDGSNRPTMTPEKVNAQFKDFFGECERRLMANPLTQWPTTWSDDTKLGPWFAEQKNVLQKYQDRSGQTLWDEDQQALNAKPPQWPQYYIGAFPYCFRLPQYPQQASPQPGGGQLPAPLMMGQSPGIHWYHAHKHGSTAIDVANGMTGVFIIEGAYDDELNKWYGTPQVPDWTRKQPVLVINQLGGSPNIVRKGRLVSTGRQDKGPEFMVNGRYQPMIDMAPGEVQLWRIANTSGRSGAFFAGPPPGFEWMQLAKDGVQLAEDKYQGSKNGNFLMAAGNRVDLLVKAPPPGLYPVLVQHEVDPGDLPSASPVVLLFVRVRADVPPATGKRAQFIDHAPAQPPFLGNISDQEVGNKISKTIRFKSDASGIYTMHTINDHKFQDGDQPFTVDLNTAEEWKIVNESYGFGPANSQLVSHPFHIHINPFQLVEVFNPNQTVQTQNGIAPKYVFYNDPAPDPAQCYLDPAKPESWSDCHNPLKDDKNRIWWDVFPIPSGGVATDKYGQPLVAKDAQGNPMKDAKGNPVYILVPGYFRMRSRFVDFAGSYVMHCHILAHEDRGMMATVTVGPPPSVMPMHH